MNENIINDMLRKEGYSPEKLEQKGISIVNKLLYRAEVKQKLSDYQQTLIARYYNSNFSDETKSAINKIIEEIGMFNI